MPKHDDKVGVALYHVFNDIQKDDRVERLAILFCCQVEMLASGSSCSACQSKGLPCIDEIVLSDILLRQVAVADGIVGRLHRHELPGTAVIAYPDDPARQH